MKPNDIIPLGYNKERLSLICTDEGLHMLPEHTNHGRGDGGLHYVTITVTRDDIPRQVALRMIGFSPADIRRALDY